MRELLLLPCKIHRFTQEFNNFSIILAGFVG